MPSNFKPVTGRTQVDRLVDHPSGQPHDFPLKFLKNTKIMAITGKSGLLNWPDYPVCCVN